MIGHIAYAVGSPCPTLVLDASHLPRDRKPLLAALTQARGWLGQAGGEHVLKTALIERSEHPLYDVDYRFIQGLPGGPSGFDLIGSCGHSILAAIVAGAESGMLPKLGPGVRNRVNILNNGDHVVCEVDEVQRNTVEFTVHFIQTPPKPLSSLLLAAEPRTELSVDGGTIQVSLVSAGNPYVFVDAASLSITTLPELFADDQELFERLRRIRAAASARLGTPPESVFPKIAVVMPLDTGRVAVRAVSVPKWHPTLALTGAACLGAAASIVNTIPWLAVNQAGVSSNGQIDIETPGGSTAVRAAVRVNDGEPALAWASIAHKKVMFHGSFFIEPLAHLQFKEVRECLSLSAA